MHGRRKMPVHVAPSRASDTPGTRDDLGISTGDPFSGGSAGARPSFFQRVRFTIRNYRLHRAASCFAAWLARTCRLKTPSACPGANLCAKNRVHGPRERRERHSIGVPNSRIRDTLIDRLRTDPFAPIHKRKGSLMLKLNNLRWIIPLLLVVIVAAYFIVGTVTGAHAAAVHGITPNAFWHP